MKQKEHELPLNELSPFALVTVSILQGIKVDLLIEKARLQRDGAALVEPEYEPEPDQADYIPSDQNLIEGGKISFDALISSAVNKQPPDDKQIGIDEAISEAEKQLPKTSEEDMIHMPKKQAPQPTLRARIFAWLAARGVWKVRKAELDYEYGRTKQSVIDMCYGIDYAIGLIDREIKRQCSSGSVRVKVQSDDPSDE